MDRDNLALVSLGGGVALLIFLCYLAHQWLFPKILKYPYPAPTSSPSCKKQSVLLAGSYNPPHKGHLEMLKYLSSRYGRVVAVVGFNPSKKYDVSPQQRLALLERMIEDAGIEGNVEARLVPGLIWRWALKNNISKMYRGVRTWEKDGNGESHLLLQNTVWPVLIGPLKLPVKTVFLEGNPLFNHISSTVVRDRCVEARKVGRNPAAEDLTGLVPDCIATKVCEIYGA